MRIQRALTPGIFLCGLLAAGNCVAAELPQFSDVTQESGIQFKHSYGDFDLSNIVEGTGAYFKQKYVGRGATHADYDNDGDLDLLIANLNDRPRLLRNDGGNQSKWLKVTPLLPGGQSAAIGAIVSCNVESLEQVQCLMPVTGYLSQADMRLHFGTGSKDVVSTVKIRWPNGEETVLEDVTANQTLTVVQDTPGQTVSQLP